MRVCWRVPILATILLTWTLPRGAVPAGEIIRPRERGDQATFDGQVAPLLAKYCFECHGASKPRAGLNLSSFHGEGAVADDPETWAKVLGHVEAREMPPKGRPRPDEHEVDRIVGYVDRRLAEVECRVGGDPGRLTLRRLNRAEYNNTIRDLVGVDFQPARDFPSDDVGYGFDNNGDVLTLPPILLEKYLAAAEAIAERAIVVDGPYRGPAKSWIMKDLDDSAGGSRYGDSARLLARAGEIKVRFTFPKDGVYVLKARAFGQQAGSEPARMEFRIDGKGVKTVDVAATEDAPATFETRVQVAAGERTLSLAFINDFYQPEEPNPDRRDRNLGVEMVEIRGPIDDQSESLPESHRRIFNDQSPTDSTRVECARAIIERFASRAFRRPATAEEVARLAWFVDLAEQGGEPFERGVQVAVEAVLVSPHFLFRVEIDPLSSTSPPHPVDDFELATRLSYFLWSSLPDEPLFELARRGRLRMDGNLEGQVRRMLKDPKASALVENFAGQWLQLRKLKSATPDPARFPSFDEDLRAAMLKETETFFRAIVDEDRSVLDFLDADFTFVNERLARHYGIEGIKGSDFRRVTLNGGRRGGLLTQASILTITSNPTRTSPVKRGKWVLEELLGTPPPPPPPDVPELSEAREVVASGTLRQRLEQHRANPNCATCHARMDPLGFGLENFDAIGAWRDHDGAFPIDPSGTLPSGQSFESPAELRAILRQREGQFTRCLTEKMLTYALGRGLERADRCEVDRIAAALARNENRFSRLVLEIVQSPLFQSRKGHED